MKGSTVAEAGIAQDRSVLHARLVKGAEHLGALWKGGTRCRGEWGSICVCDKPSAFCIVKKKWLGLVLELYGDEYPYNLVGWEGFLVLECMDSDMFKASGIQIVKTSAGGRALSRFPRERNPFQDVLDAAPLEGPNPSEMGSLVRVSEIM